MRVRRILLSFTLCWKEVDWVVRNHHPDLLRGHNAAAREGRYKDELWEMWTGTPLEELGALWIKSHRERLL